MTTYGREKDTWRDKAEVVAIVLVMIFLLATLSQPLWRGQEMVKELKDRCMLADGKVYERKSWLGGTVYECIEGEQ